MKPSSLITTAAALGLNASGGHLAFHCAAVLDFCFRLICSARCNGSVEAVDQAFDLADSHLGVQDGPVLVARTAAFIRALRQECQECFKFLSPGCHHISPDELAFQAVVKAARQKDDAILHAVAELAVKGSQTVQVRHAAKLLAEAQLHPRAREDVRRTATLADVEADPRVRLH
jgi:hypothetical protein